MNRKDYTEDGKIIKMALFDKRMTQRELVEQIRENGIPSANEALLSMAMHGYLTPTTERMITTAKRILGEGGV